MKQDKTTLAQMHKPLTPSEETRLRYLLKDEPVLARWFALIEQDVVQEDRLAGARFDMPAEVAKAMQTYTAGKRDVVATLAQAVHQSNPEE